MKKVIFATLLCSIVFASTADSTNGTILGCNAAIDNIFHFKISNGMVFSVDPSQPSGKAQIAFIIYSFQNSLPVAVNFRPGNNDFSGFCKADDIYTPGIG